MTSNTILQTFKSAKLQNAHVVYLPPRRRGTQRITEKVLSDPDGKPVAREVILETIEENAA